MHSEQLTYTAFAGFERIASGPLRETVLGTKAFLDRSDSPLVLVFEDQTGTQVDFDWRGTPDDVLGRLPRHPYLAPIEQAEEPRRTGPGRPKLGVVSREVSLLPRHWEWLGEQPGGASAMLRRLVDQARRSTVHEQQGRRTREAVSRFLSAVAGNLPDYEEASRALFASERARFVDLIAGWPPDVRSHLLNLWPAVATPGEREPAAHG